MLIIIVKDIKWYYGETKDIATEQKIAPAYDIQWKKPDEKYEGNKMKILKLFELSLEKTMDSLFSNQIGQTFFSHRFFWALKY